MIATALALNPYEIISNTLTNIVRWVLDQLGVEGIAATAVIVALAWLWWGYKLNALAGAGRSVAATVAQHAVVSAAVAVAVLLGLLYAGVIPGVDMQATNALVSGALDLLPLLVSPWEWLRQIIAAPAEMIKRGMFVNGEVIAEGAW